MTRCLYTMYVSDCLNDSGVCIQCVSLIVSLTLVCVYSVCPGCHNDSGVCIQCMSDCLNDSVYVYNVYLLLSQWFWCLYKMCVSDCLNDWCLYTMYVSGCLNDWCLYTMCVFDCLNDWCLYTMCVLVVSMTGVCIQCVSWLSQ